MSEAERLGKLAERSKDIRTALLAVREYQRGAELVNKVQDASVQHARIERDDRWIALRDALLQAIAPYPDAHKAVVAVLEGMTGGFQK